MHILKLFSELLNSHIIFKAHFGLSIQFNTLRPEWSDHSFADNIFKWVLLNENVGIMNKISLKCVPSSSFDVTIGR